MSGEKVLLMELRERTSASGNRYLSDWLGKASVVAFLDREAEEPTWQVFVSTPTPRPTGSNAQAQFASKGRPYPGHRPAARSRSGKETLPPGDLDNRLDDL